MPNNNIQSGLYASLARVGAFFFNKMSDKVPTKKIIEHTKVESPVTNSDGGYVDIVIDTSENGAPMAGAFEWGSGIHGDKGQKYPILPRNAAHGFLAIPASRWPNKLYDDDPAILKYVFHPGVAAKPYIEPTIRENLPEIRKMLANDFKQAILSGIEKVVVIE